MSIPLSTSTTTNDYIDSINSEFNFQLAELTVFQFPNSDQCKFKNTWKVKRIVYMERLTHLRNFSKRIRVGCSKNLRRPFMILWRCQSRDYGVSPGRAFNKLPGICLSEKTPQLTGTRDCWYEGFLLNWERLTHFRNFEDTV